MFDKLIESNLAEAEFKPRRKYFMVSSVVVGILFLSAVVFSLYAQDIDLGTDNFELAELLAPVAADAPEPEPPRQQTQQTNDQDRSELPSRRDLIASIDQTPKAPPSISTTPFIGRTMPLGRFNLNPNGPETDGSGLDGPPTGREGTSSATVEPVAEIVKAPIPAPAVATKPPTVRSEGVINGKATYLPVPAYPSQARIVGAYGVVNVQVMIDVDGRVISSKAVSGHPLLRPTAESAAWKARFSPTYLSRVPVKVTGVIVFNFKKG
jgi:periplasmic protein TonB